MSNGSLEAEDTEHGLVDDIHNAAASGVRSRPAGRDQGDQDARAQALQRELDKVRGVNEVVSKVIHSLERSRNNMETVHNSVRTASTLLDTWTRILSQTEHNQRLLLNPNWKGATQDMEELENESMLRQQIADRRAAEEDMRREAAAKAAAEEDERKRSATPSGTRTARGRGRSGVASRGAPSVRGGSSAPSTAARRTTVAPGRAGSGIGRGIGASRGRGRGV